MITLQGNPASLTADEEIYGVKIATPIAGIAAGDTLNTYSQTQAFAADSILGSDGNTTLGLLSATGNDIGAFDLIGDESGMHFTVKTAHY